MTTATSSPRRIYSVRWLDGGQAIVERLGRTTLEAAVRHVKRQARNTYDTSDGTLWIDAEILDARGEVVRDLRSFAIDPREPDCDETTNGEHDWRDDGATGFGDVVRGNGGGVVCASRCKLCGLRRVTDTWATRPDTGEQGLTSVRYECGS